MFKKFQRRLPYCRDRGLVSNLVGWTRQLYSSMIEEIEVLVEEVYYGRCGWDSYLFEGKIMKIC